MGIGNGKERQGIRGAERERERERERESNDLSFEWVL